MSFSSICKKTISVSKDNQLTPFYLIFDKEKSLQTKTGIELKKPKNYYISILLSIQMANKSIIGNFGISEILIPGITDSSIFNIYACFFNSNSDSSKTVMFSGVFKLKTSKCIQFHFQNNQNGSHQIECIFSIVPFVAPNFDKDLSLLPYLSFSFIHFIPQIKEFNSNWPLISWIRQTQYNEDSSINELYNILFPKHEIDLMKIYQGLKTKQNKQILNEQDPIHQMKKNLYRSINDADIDQPGISFSELNLIVNKITKTISSELDLSYKVFSIEPQYSISIDETPEILVFCPIFGVTGSILTEIMCNDAAYTLYSIVKNEEDEITATIYSPYTKLFYDIRNSTVTPLNRNYPPVSNINEVYLMLLYINQTPHSFFSKSCSPISIFYPKYDYVNVIDCKLGEKIPNQRKRVLTDSVECDSTHISFEFDENNLPFPSIPLTQICGKSILRFTTEKQLFRSPSMMVWDAIRADDQNPLKIDYVPQVIELNEHFDIFKDYPNHIFAIIQDHTFAAIFHSVLLLGQEVNAINKSFPIQNTVRYEKCILKYRNANYTKLTTISFTRNSPQDKYISFVGTPILLEVDFENDFDALKLDIMAFEKVLNIFVKHETFWKEISNPEAFLDILPSIRYVELLIQIL